MSRAEKIRRLGLPALARLRLVARGRRPCVSATATIATSRAIAPRPNRPTAPSGGISARSTRPNTIRNGTISKGSTRKKRRRVPIPKSAPIRAIPSPRITAGPDSGDGSRSRDEVRALDLLGLTPDADFDAVKKAWRAKAKEVHPDVKPGDAEAAKAFQAIQLAYEVLRAAEERRRVTGLRSSQGAGRNPRSVVGIRGPGDSRTRLSVIPSRALRSSGTGRGVIAGGARQRLSPAEADRELGDYQRVEEGESFASRSCRQQREGASGAVQRRR